MFTDRTDGAAKLVEKLKNIDKKNTIVLALPRGGVPVADIIASKLGLEFDILSVKKIGFPANPELALGAVTEDGAIYINDTIRKMSGLSEKELDVLIKKNQELAVNKSRYFRFGKEGISVKGKNVIIVDDGIATGATIEACINQVKRVGARKIMIAVPVAPKDILEKLLHQVDEIFVLETPSPFVSVSKWYENFDQVYDTEVREIFEKHQEKFETIEEIMDLGEIKLKAKVSKVIDNKAWIIFVHGSGSSRLSERNNQVAKVLNKGGLSTLLFDLLTLKEDSVESNRFNIELLKKRLVLAINWLVNSEYYDPSTPIGLFGASTGAAAAIKVAAQFKDFPIYAVVCRGGRPDLADRDELRDVTIPTLLIIGGMDYQVLELNKKAYEQLPNSEIQLIAGATHLFEESGTMESVSELTKEWFLDKLENFDSINFLTQKPNFFGDIGKQLH